MQEAVTTAHETSDAFSDETLKEQAIFQRAKEAEMKEMLGTLADGQIEMYSSVSCLATIRPSQISLFKTQAIEEWERIIPILQRIRVDV